MTRMRPLLAGDPDDRAGVSPALLRLGEALALLGPRAVTPPSTGRAAQRG